MSNHSCEMFLGALSLSTLTQLQQYTPKNILYKHGSALNDKSKVQCKHLNGVLRLALCQDVVCLVCIIW